MRTTLHRRWIVRGRARSAASYTQPYLQWLGLLAWRDLTHARSRAARAVKGQRQCQRILHVIQHAIEKAHSVILDREESGEAAADAKCTSARVCPPRLNHPHQLFSKRQCRGEIDSDKDVIPSRLIPLRELSFRSPMAVRQLHYG